uniref:Uncharacterized protein n=1 Tax=Parascaris univalens TaxID=6257 RepID=A0A915A873_PARUN
MKESPFEAARKNSRNRYECEQRKIFVKVTSLTVQVSFLRSYSIDNSRITNNLKGKNLRMEYLRDVAFFIGGNRSNSSDGTSGIQ